GRLSRGGGGPRRAPGPGRARPSRTRRGPRRQRPPPVPPALTTKTAARRADPTEAAMLRTRLIHPEILAALAAAGHGSRVLISDGNFPPPPAPPPRPRLVFLNLSPGRVTVTEVLEAVAPTVPLEAAAVMRPHDADAP